MCEYKQKACNEWPGRMGDRATVSEGGRMKDQHQTLIEQTKRRKKDTMLCIRIYIKINPSVESIENRWKHTKPNKWQNKQSDMFYIIFCCCWFLFYIVCPADRYVMHYVYPISMCVGMMYFVMPIVSIQLFQYLHKHPYSAICTSIAVLCTD